MTTNAALNTPGKLNMPWLANSISQPLRAYLPGKKESAHGVAPPPNDLVNIYMTGMS